MKQIPTQYEMEQMVEEVINSFKYKLSEFDLKSETRFIRTEFEKSILEYARFLNETKPEHE